MLRAAAPYLTDDFVETNFDFYGRTLNGTPELRARWKRGVALVEGAIGEAVGKEYVARHFPPTRRRRWTSWSPTCWRRTASRSPSSTG